MDAHALLSSQGWRGKGHSLHKTDDSIGLAKPILVSKKNNTKGLGQKQHFTSDQWWMNAFDEQLQGLDTSKEGKVVQTIKTGKLNAIEQGSFGKYALYASFVRGGFLQGTIKGTDEDTSTSESDDEEPTIAKTQQIEPKKETKEEKRQRKEAKRKRKEQRALARAARRERKSKRKTDTSDDPDEEKRKRRARKEEKRRQRKKESKSKED